MPRESRDYKIRVAVDSEKAYKDLRRLARDVGVSQRQVNASIDTEVRRAVGIEGQRARAVVSASREVLRQRREESTAAQSLLRTQAFASQIAIRQAIELQRLEGARARTSLASTKERILLRQGETRAMEAQSRAELNAARTSLTAAKVQTEALRQRGALARATFDLRTLPVPRPEIEVFGVFETGNLLTTGEVRPGDTLRAIGGSAADLLPDPLLVWEVGLRYREGVLSFTFNAQDERKDAVRRIRDLVKKVASRVVRGGTGQALFSTGAGGGGGATGGGSADFGSLAPTTTKGDLIVHDGAENVRLPVGANGQTPMPDSSLPAGIGYVTAVGSRWAAVVRQDFLFGKGDFYSTTSGTGASADLSDNYGDTGGHPGCLVLTPGTTTSGNAFIGTFGAYNGCVKLGYGEWIIEECVYLTHLSDGTDRFTLRLGMGDKTSGNPTDGVFFRYTDNANSGKWECVTRNNDTETASDSGITVAATTWYRLSIHINAAASSVAFYIDGALVATNTTNIPTTGRNTSFMNSMGKSAGTNARYALLDYVNVDCLLSTPR